MDATVLRAALEWDRQPASEPYDLTVSDEEREQTLALWRWFSRFSPSEKLRILARQRRMVCRLRELGRAGGR
jgi:hypothetical protein